MKLKVTLMMLFVAAFSFGVYAQQACCTGQGISYPNGATTISYTPSVSTTTTSSTSISYVGDPNVISMGSTYSAPSTTYTGSTYTGEYASSGTFYPSRSCCQGPATTYPTGNTASVTSYGTSTSTTDYGVGAGDPNVIYMEGFTTTTPTDTYIPPTSDVGNSCCGGPGISYPGNAGTNY